MLNLFHFFICCEVYQEFLKYMRDRKKKRNKKMFVVHYQFIQFEFEIELLILS